MSKEGRCELDYQIIGVVCAAIAVFFSVFWVVLGLRGVRSIEDLRKELALTRAGKGEPK